MKEKNVKWMLTGTLIGALLIPGAVFAGQRVSGAGGSQMQNQQKVMEQMRHQTQHRYQTPQGEQIHEGEGTGEQTREHEGSGEMEQNTIREQKRPGESEE